MKYSNNFYSFENTFEMLKIMGDLCNFETIKSIYLLLNHWSKFRCFFFFFFFFFFLNLGFFFFYNLGKVLPFKLPKRREGTRRVP